jgi:uncharacterized Zn-binding protein involved in type VI secretion|tara:strand:- start:2371 stop:2718 length:348 start_codon:yes stop_codon:yes gene_type:complete
MPLVARKDGVDVVDTVHVSVGDADPLDGIACDAAPQIIATEAGSPDVFAVGVGVVRDGDVEESHTIPGCTTHQTGLATFSENVFANGKAIGRLNDTYKCGAKIINVTQSTVFANG